jgi:hypothetical protein
VKLFLSDPPLLQLRRDPLGGSFFNLYGIC